MLAAYIVILYFWPSMHVHFVRRYINVDDALLLYLHLFNVYCNFIFLSMDTCSSCEVLRKFCISSLYIVILYLFLLIVIM